MGAYNSPLRVGEMRFDLAPLDTPQAGVAQLVEHDVANVVVVGSNPIARSIILGLRGIEWVSLGSEGPRKLCIS